MRLILFDIDGTLIQSNGVGREVMRISLEQVYGSAGQLDTYSFAGKTDLKIIWDILTANGILAEKIEQGLPKLYDQMAEWGEKLFYQNGLSPCIGVMALLALIGRRRDMLLGLQTGNIQSTAALKLDAAGIDPRIFRIGAYGSDSSMRRDLIPLAKEQAEVICERSLDNSEVIVIGDTPADIECAKDNGVKSLAVATGYYEFDSLAAVDPDFLVKDLSETDAILDLLLG